MRPATPRPPSTGDASSQSHCPSAQTLVFDANERGPDEDLRLQLEATTRLTDDEKHVLKTVTESILLSHEAKRWAA